jgi:hypothetical protein
MESLQRTASHALRTLLDGQPVTPAKMRFVWTLAAGAALARATDVEWRDAEGVLVVRARTDNWRRELRRARPILTERVRELAGRDAVRRLEIK